MNIGEAQAFSNLPVKTIRYYEEIGLISPKRLPNGYRDFADGDIHKLVFLAHARSLGFSIENCRELLSLYNDKGRASADVKRVATAHLVDIDRKRQELGVMRETLSHLIHNCNGDDRPNCPILDGLAETQRERQ
jgi:MerR family copper efflux transcriptional regulator